MVVLYMVFKCFLGGHVLSAFTVAKQMQKSDVITIFLGGEGSMVNDIEKFMPFEHVEIPIYYKNRQTYFTWQSLNTIQEVRRIIKNHCVDLIHAFDARSYMHAYPAGLLEGVPAICTLCGGVDPYYNLPIASAIMVFSEEQRHKMIKHYCWPEECVQLVRTRLDLQQMYDEQNYLPVTEAASLGIIMDIPKLMMISSFDSTKIQSIYKLLDVVEVLYQQGLRFQLVLIGGKGELFLQAKARGEELCARYGPGYIIFTGPVKEAFRLLQHADIVLGVGRSAFEGMAYGKPTLIIGKNGFAGEVCKEKIDEIAWYNFSGRNYKTNISGKSLEIEIRKLLRDKSYRCQLGDFGKDFVLREIDVAQGAGRILNIYKQIVCSGERFTPCKQWISFGLCLLPIIRDNILHSIKIWVKALLTTVRTSMKL